MMQHTTGYIDKELSVGTPQSIEYDTKFAAWRFIQAIPHGFQIAEYRLQPLVINGLTYSVGNRTACIRIPGYQRDPKTMRFEFRPSDGTMNPYLAYSALLMAGMDGIKNKIDPGLPLDKNLDTLPAEELAKIHQLPTSLNKALNALEEDYDFLTEGNVFTEDLLEHWVALKRKEVTEIRVRPTPYEFYLYFDL